MINRVDQFFAFTGGFSAFIYQHAQFAFLCTDHHILAVHPAHHIKRVPRSASQGQFQGIFFDPFGHRLLEFRLDFEVTVCRAYPFYPLVGAAVVVIVYPDRNALLGVLEAVELGPQQEPLQDRPPEPLSFSQRHRMVRAASDMFHPVLLQFLLEGGRSPPVDVLASVIRQHLFGYAIFSDCPAIRFQHVRRRLAPVKPQAGYIT